ncbi:YjcZ family sporulation protein [Pseudomonas donghuensis]
MQPGAAPQNRHLERSMGKLAFFVVGFLALAIAIGALGTISPL